MMRRIFSPRRDWLKNMQIYRFNKTERAAHAINGMGFFALLITGLMLLFRKELALKAARIDLLVNIHLVSAGVYIFGPLLCWLFGDTTSWIRWVRDALHWRPSDIAWMVKIPFHMLRFKVALPDQERFNAGQRVNIIGQFIAKILFLYSGLMLWLFRGQLWMVYLHLATAAFSFCLLMVHIYLAVLHRDTRPGLKGMATGWVSAEWAKHHYTHWHRRQPEHAFRPIPQQTASPKIFRQHRRHEHRLDDDITPIATALKSVTPLKPTKTSHGITPESSS